MAHGIHPEVSKLNELLPHYERELALLRERAAAFAREFPKIAGRLQLSGDVADDPQVERLFESFAFIASRVHERLGDDFSLFTESFLGALYPQYLRPFPSCAVAQVRLPTDATALDRTWTLKRGTILESPPVRGVSCKFRCAYDTTVLPIRLASVVVRGAIDAPDASQVPKAASSVLSLRFERLSPLATWASLTVPAIRLYADGEGSLPGVLREMLCGRVLAMSIQTSTESPWEACRAAVPQTVGFASDEALIDVDGSAYDAYRLLTEYFAFPAKFNFVDIPVPAAWRHSVENSVTVHLAMQGVGPDEARVLETVTERNLLLNCTPISNQFKSTADRIRIKSLGERHAVRPKTGPGIGWEVLAIDRVYRISNTPQGDSRTEELSALYSLRHGVTEDDAEGLRRGHWHARRNEFTVDAKPGHEMEISIVDMRGDPVDIQADTLSVEVRATNRDLPCLLSAGDAGGDLVPEGGDLTRRVRLVSKPSPTYRFKRRQGAHWRLISHLSLNHLSLCGPGVDALREMLELYNLPGSAANRRLIDGVVGIDSASTRIWMPGVPMPSFVRGLEIRLTVDANAFSGLGLRLFAQVMDHFFILCVHGNSCTQLTLLSIKTHEELVVCPPRRGESPLL